MRRGRGCHKLTEKQKSDLSWSKSGWGTVKEFRECTYTETKKCSIDYNSIREALGIEKGDLLRISL